MPSENKPEQTPAREAGEVAVQKWMDEKQPVQRKFPGPAGQQIQLRVAMEREAFAELVAHARESLQAEVCGVLAGDVCEDGEGLFVDVKVAVRGSAAREGGTHVTFTQETWNTIHETMEKKFPKLQIMGWYHSHPGFGVEFSDMDLFIQQNFFPGKAQFALVTDPLGGDTAICVNTPDGTRYINRFWVDGREHRCRTPGAAQSGDGAGMETGAAGPLSARMKELEERMGQVIQAADEQRKLFNQVLMTAFFFACICVAGLVCYMIYTSYSSRFEPPRLMSYAPVPVKIGDKTAILGVGVVQWDIPPELEAQLAKAGQKTQQDNKPGTTSPAPEAKKPQTPDGK